jgi:hypothetical protein
MHRCSQNQTPSALVIVNMSQIAVVVIVTAGMAVIIISFPFGNYLFFKYKDCFTLNLSHTASKVCTVSTSVTVDLNKWFI